MTVSHETQDEDEMRESQTDRLFAVDSEVGGRDHQERIVWITAGFVL